MLDVVIALIPAVICSVVFYGWRELLLLGVSVASCVLLEWAVTRYLLRKPSTIGDLSAVITGILLALNVPYTLPWWIMVIGAVVAIGVAKLTFGGIGQNVFNPAIVGRVFLLVSYPSQMTHWEQPQGLFGIDAVTGATPLGAVKEGSLQIADIDYAGLLFANIGGSAGEVCAIALLVGFIYLLCRRVIKPWITLSIFATVALTSLIFWGINPERFTDPLFNLLTGGLILGACFMATDYVTSPMSTWGGVVFGVGIGFITMMIRYFGSYPEGVSFAILIMNSVVPLLNRAFKHRKYGRK